MGFKLRMMEVDGCLYFYIFVFLYFFVVERCLDSKIRKKFKFYKYDNISSYEDTVEVPVYICRSSELP
jgi:hypothetical protein